MYRQIPSQNIRILNLFFLSQLIFGVGFVEGRVLSDQMRIVALVEEDLEVSILGFGTFPRFQLDFRRAYPLDSVRLEGNVKLFPKFVPFIMVSRIFRICTVRSGGIVPFLWFGRKFEIVRCAKNLDLLFILTFYEETCAIMHNPEVMANITVGLTPC